jgi:hypothetical protein
MVHQNVPCCLEAAGTGNAHRLPAQLAFGVDPARAPVWSTTQ